MNNLENLNYDKVSKLYSKYFSLGYLGANMSDKFAAIALTCYITKEIRKKGKKMNCYDILLQICKDFSDEQKNTFLKSLGAICEDLMYGCEDFLDFGISPKEMPKQLKNILDKYCPF